MSVSVTSEDILQKSQLGERQKKGWVLARIDQLSNWNVSIVFGKFQNTASSLSSEDILY